MRNFILCIAGHSALANSEVKQKKPQLASRPLPQRSELHRWAWRMGDGTVHDGIFKSNFTAGKRREISSVAFGKVAVGNEILGNAFCGSDAYATLQSGQSGSWERGIPPQIIMKRRH